MGRAIFGGHSGNLAGEAVAERVEAGGLFAIFRFGACGQKGVAAIGFESLVGNHKIQMADADSAIA